MPLLVLLLSSATCVSVPEASLRSYPGPIGSADESRLDILNKRKIKGFALVVFRRRGVKFSSIKVTGWRRVLTNIRTTGADP